MRISTSIKKKVQYFGGSDACAGDSGSKKAHGFSESDMYIIIYGNTGCGVFKRGYKIRKVFA